MGKRPQGITLGGREFQGDGARLIIHQPQLDEWIDYRELRARAAVKVIPPGETLKPAVGALLVETQTRTDTQGKTVYLYNLTVKSIHFPGVKGEEAEQLSAIVRKLVPTGPMTVSAERMLAAVDRAQASSSGVAVSLSRPDFF